MSFLVQNGDELKRDVNKTIEDEVCKLVRVSRWVDELVLRGDSITKGK